MKNKTNRTNSATSPFAIGSVYNNNTIFDSQGKIRAENTDFAIGTPFEKDIKMNLSNSLVSNNAQGNSTGYLFGNGSPLGITGYNLTGPFISKRQTSDIRATNSPRTTSPSVMMMSGNDIPGNNGSSLEINGGVNLKQANKDIPLNPFDIVDVEGENSEEHEDDNLLDLEEEWGWRPWQQTDQMQTWTRC